MDGVGAVILLAFVSALALVASWWLWQLRRFEGAKKWPGTEGTIESGDMEDASTTGRGLFKVPVFAFSYKVNEEFYSGYFTLLPGVEPGESLVKRLVDRKLRVQYNPRRPSMYFIPDSMIEGCEVKQKLDPHLFSVFPTE